MGFHQIELEEQSRDVTTFVTHRGLYRYKRLMFGITSAPKKYQKIISDVIQGCDGVVNIADNLIVYGSDLDIARNRGHLSRRNVQRTPPQTESKMAAHAQERKCGRVIENYKELHNLSSIVLYDTAPRKKGKLYEVERIITRRKSKSVSKYFLAFLLLLDRSAS